jgi:dTDP-4-dehydrorhamnose 3,5-epimerase
VQSTLEPESILGLRWVDLAPHPDERGSFVEFFREEWRAGPEPRQWNAVRSGAGVVRGVHVHAHHHDYLTVVSGTLVLGLHDLRPDSPTHGLAGFLTLSEATPAAVAIPPGVCHGFWFPEPSVHVYGVSEYWNAHDELACRFDDPALGLDWPVRQPLLSERDREAGSLAAMRADYLAALA